MSQEEKKPLSTVLMEKQNLLEKEIQNIKTILTENPKKDVKQKRKPKRKTGQVTDNAVSNNDADRVSHIRHILDCPDCNKQFKEQIQELVMCEDCGAIVNKSDPKCKFCEGTNAKPIS